MTDITTDPSDKIKRNAEIAAKSFHTYVVGAVSLGASILLALGPEWVTAFIQAHPTISAGAPFVSLLFVLLAQITPQNITLATDKQKEARDFMLAIAARLMPGQPMSLPPAIAKAAGLPDVVQPRITPAPVDPTRPMPGSAVMRVAPPPPAPAAPPAVVPPPAFDLRSQFRESFPAWTEAQVDAAVAQFPSRTSAP